MSIIKKIRENFQKKQASERYQNFSEEEKRETTKNVPRYQTLPKEEK